MPIMMTPMVLAPSMAEGFGFPLLEAMSSGTPVVTSREGATAEVAGDAALLVDPLSPAAIAGAARRLLGEPDLRRELVERGRARVREFSWERAAAGTRDAYRAAMGRTA